MADRRPNPRQPSSVLRAVKDAYAPLPRWPAAALHGPGRDEAMAVQSNKGMPERKHESSHHNQQPLPLDPTTGVNASSHRPVGAPQPGRHHLGTVADFKSVRVAGFKSEDLAGFVGICT